MYIHIGYNEIINTNDIIGIFDMDKATVEKDTRDFINKFAQEGSIVNVGTVYDLPKTFIICSDKKGDNVLYITPITVQTLKLRLTGKMKNI